MNQTTEDSGRAVFTARMVVIERPARSERRELRLGTEQGVQRDRSRARIDGRFCGRRPSRNLRRLFDRLATGASGCSKDFADRFVQEVRRNEPLETSKTPL